MRARARSAMSASISQPIAPAGKADRLPQPAPDPANQSPRQVRLRAARADQDFQQRRRFLGRMDGAAVAVAQVDDRAHEARSAVWLRSGRRRSGRYGVDAACAPNRASRCVGRYLDVVVDVAREVVSADRTGRPAHTPAEAIIVESRCRSASPRRSPARCADRRWRSGQRSP